MTHVWAYARLPLDFAPRSLKEIIKDPRPLLNYLLYHLFCMTEPFAPGSDKFKLAWKQCSTSYQVEEIALSAYY